MAHRPTHRYVATTSLGLEGVLAEELNALGATAVVPWAGGASFEGDRHLMMRACLWLRTAHRVRWILDECQVRTQDDLYPVARRVARWERLCPPDRTIAVRASLRQAPFQDERIVALKVKDAIVDTVRDSVGTRPDVSGKDPDVGIHVRLSGSRATFSLDAAGQSLHIRGYRTQSGPAPLRETLAAGALLMSGWDGTRPLVDPMCGSGTLLVEGALIATGRAPGLEREFGFQRWPNYRARAWEEIRQEAVEAIRPSEVALVGREVSARVLAYAQGNAKRAGVGEVVRWEQGRMEETRRPDGPAGLFVTNPPYGERLGDRESAEEVYRQLGGLMGRAFSGWRATLFVAERRHRDAVGLEVLHEAPVKNGALDVVLCAYQTSPWGGSE